jgi:hypothetical protein
MDKGENTNSKSKPKVEVSNSEDVQKLTDEIISKLRSTKPKRGGKSSARRIFSLKINPLFLIILSFVIAIFFINLLTRSSVTSVNTSLDNIVKGLKDNRFSQISIQNDGKVVATSKSYLMLDSSSEFVASEKDGYKFSSYKNG